MGNSKGGGALLLAGIAAFAYYKYNKMSADEKKNIVSDVKGKAQKFYDDYVPAEVKDLIGKKQGAQTAAATSFDEAATYGS